MTRTARVTVPDGIYHVTARGNGDEAILASAVDKEGLLRLLAAVVREREWQVMAYCVMDNHYHLVLRTPLDNLSDGMHALNGAYGKDYNDRHGHRGHVFQGRFFSILFASDSHLLEVCRYVVLNPVRAHLTAVPGDWPWSSYGATASGSRSAVPLSDGILLSMLGAPAGQDQRGTYREFVAAGMALPRPECLKLPSRGRPPCPSRAVPSLRHRQYAPGELSDRIREMYMAGSTAGFIAEQLGVSRMTVARYLRERSGGKDDV